MHKPPGDLLPVEVGQDPRARNPDDVGEDGQGYGQGHQEDSLSPSTIHEVGEEDGEHDKGHHGPDAGACIRDLQLGLHEVEHVPFTVDRDLHQGDQEMGHLGGEELQGEGNQVIDRYRDRNHEHQIDQGKLEQPEDLPAVVEQDQPDEAGDDHEPGDNRDLPGKGQKVQDHAHRENHQSPGAASHFGARELFPLVPDEERGDERHQDAVGIVGAIEPGLHHLGIDRPEYAEPDTEEYGSLDPGGPDGIAPNAECFLHGCFPCLVLENWRIG